MTACELIQERVLRIIRALEKSDRLVAAAENKTVYQELGEFMRDSAELEIEILHDLLREMRENYIK
jgi:hypothetical protein